MNQVTIDGNSLAIFVRNPPYLPQHVHRTLFPPARAEHYFVMEQLVRCSDGESSRVQKRD